MADDAKLHALTVSIEANTKGIEKALKRLADQNTGAFGKMQRDAKKSLAGIESALSSADKRMAGFGRTLLPSLGALTAAMSTREVLRYADAWTNAKNALAVAGVTGQKQVTVLNQLYAAAQANAAPLGALADLYGKAAQASDNLGASQADLLKFSGGVATALRVAGTSASGASGALTQLGQLLGQTRVQAEEFNSINESARPILMAVAEGLDKAGGSVSKLKALVNDGKVSGQQFFQAFLKGLPAVEAMAANATQTIEQGLVKVGNAMTKYIGETDESLGASQRLIQGLNSLADNFSETADFALQLASVIAGALIGRSIVAMIGKVAMATEAVIAFGKAIAAARTIGMASALGSLGAVAGPLGAIIGGVLVGSMVLFSGRSKEASEGARVYANALRQVEAAAAKSAEAIDDTSAAITEQNWNALTEGLKLSTEEMDAARQAASDLFEQLFLNADMSAATPKQVKELEAIRDAFNNGTKSAEQTKQALFALANANPDFQAVADSFTPVLDAVTKTAAALGLVKNQIDSFGAGPSVRQAENDTMAAYEAMKAASDKFVADAQKRNSLSKDELALEVEIAKVKADAEKAGVELGDKRIKALAEANLAADKKRSAEGKTARESEYERLTKRIEQATAAQLHENEALSRANPLIEDFGFNLAKARTEADLLAAAQESGMEVTPQLVAAIEKQAAAYAKSTAEGNALADAQDRFRREAEQTADAIRDTFVDVFSGGIQSADDFMDALADLGRMFAKMGAEKLFDFATGKTSSLFGDMPKVGGGGVSVANAGREAGRAMAQPISDRFASVGEDLASNIHAAASTLGISARDLATVISYETGGTFSTSIRGGAGNRHIGLIQFGPEEQRKYGAAVGQALSDQMQAVVGYLKDRGLKPGMDLLDLYSTINAGRPGLYNRSDANNGGAPGTVFDKVTGQMAGHQANADRILGKQVVSDGIVDAERRISGSNFQNKFDTTGPTSVAKGGGMQGALGLIGAAGGAFAGGYESGSPLMGGISGAMSGLGASSMIGSALGIGAGAATGIGLVFGAAIGLRLGGSTSKSRRISR